MSSNLTYDALGRRIMKNVNSGATVEKYLYDGQNVVADYNNSDVCQASYVTPFLDHNLIISRSGNTYYYLHDGLGSVRTIVDSSSTVQNAYDYNTYGGISSKIEGITNRYKFTGREYDTEASQYYYRGRHYKNSLARFIQRDPIGYGGGLNIYSYCGNNPVNSIDPMGLEEQKKGILGTAWDWWKRKLTPSPKPSQPAPKPPKPEPKVDTKGESVKETIKVVADAINPIPVIGPVEVSIEVVKIVPPIVGNKYHNYEAMIEAGVADTPNNIYEKQHDAIVCPYCGNNAKQPKDNPQAPAAPNPNPTDPNDTPKSPDNSHGSPQDGYVGGSSSNAPIPLPPSPPSSGSSGEN